MRPDVVAAIIRALVGMEPPGSPTTVVTCQDCRPSSDWIAHSVAEGAAWHGAHVATIRQGPSPMLDFVVREMLPGCRAEGRTLFGIMVTGSHNEAGWNGLKITMDGRPFHGERLAMLRHHAEAVMLSDLPPLRPHPIRVVDIHAMERWVRALVASARCAASRRLRVVVDGGNGVAGEPACAVLRALGHDVTPLHCVPDGSFPSHHPDPSDPANTADLRHEVGRVGADLGIAFDCDGDRLGVVADDGAHVAMDRIATLLAASVLSSSPRAIVMGDVKCSDTFFEAVDHLGGHAVMTRTGHAFVKEAMSAAGAAFAAEMSGHLYFADRWNGSDDAVHAATRLLEILAEPGARTLSAMLAGLPQLSATPEIVVPADDDAKHEIVRRVLALALDRGMDACDIDGVRVGEGQGRWWLVRASGTQPALILRAEGRTDAERDERLAMAMELVARARAEPTGTAAPPATPA